MGDRAGIRTKHVPSLPLDLLLRQQIDVSTFRRLLLKWIVCMHKLLAGRKRILQADDGLGGCCCAQQTGIGHLIVEALLAILLSEERATTYRYKEIRSTDRLSCSVQFSWSCRADISPAVLYTAEVYDLRIATDTQPIHNRFLYQMSTAQSLNS